MDKLKSLFILLKVTYLEIEKIKREIDQLDRESEIVVIASSKALKTLKYLNNI